MRWNLSRLPWPGIRIAIGVLVVVIAAVSYGSWWPALSAWVDRTLASQSELPEDAPAHRPHAASGSTLSLELTPQARRNLGLTDRYLQPIQLSTYRRSITVPAIVVAKPGRSSIVVSSPLSGVVTHVHAVTGEAVMPGELLFEVRLTYEDLVDTQTAYLKTISELEVEDREIARLEEATRSGAISGRQLLERRYAKEKLEAFARSQREALKLHGLSDRQVEEIATQGKLLRDLQIVVPDVDQHSEDEELRLSSAATFPVSYTQPPPLAFPSLDAPPVNTPADAQVEESHLLVIDSSQVHKGQAVVSGERLCSLSDYSQLFIEGKAFENDVQAIANAAKNNWSVDAVFSGSQGRETVRDLKLAYVSNSIDSSSRTLSLFVELPNRIVRDETNDEGQRFVAWQYRVGQRLELRVPVEQWEQQIVLPIEAVVKEGADWYVFQQNGKRFDRVPVHVKHRDQRAVVVAHDGSIFPGDVVALKAAHQMQMAIKNQSGGAVDPHAGHSH
ncbi:efflux RND transporter periplasmic adaptor subunit [Roseimaritima ulvae]|uniref:HlyD family secretion protein n=1 Tax=Roseimaritima ulvae TaxID=980254 RepID=A0A5B9QUS5_9BACT|nr:efflux RND transporter periplasmic adaptor subunit [Roseimaritima ulvae]QEG41530.1 hypothetical protein UC8_35540 [Roseimaritima ulvae]